MSERDEPSVDAGKVALTKSNGKGNGKFANGLLVIAALLAIAGGYLASRGMGSASHGAAAASGAVMTETRPLSEFTLQKDGGTYTRADLLGKWTVIFFGYTHCPDVCPTSLSLLAEVKAMIKAKGGSGPDVLFISVDSGRDKPDQIRQYVTSFDPAFQGVTGDDAALAPLVKQMGVYYQRNESAGGKNYTVDHSAALYLINPQAELEAIFSPPHKAETIANVVLELAAAR